MIAGVDEVGRGCLAGPVVACAVILPDDYHNKSIKDSKKLSAKKRDQLFDEINRNAVSVGIGVTCNIIIDSAGIVPATKQSMHLALSRLKPVYNSVIIDAVRLNNLSCSSINPFKAEDLYTCVAAASIVAKVYRDRLMEQLDDLFKGYAWNKNKGYGTKEHIQAIKNLGITPLHRKSFLKSLL